MANKRNQAKKATKAARVAAFRASHAQQIEAIRSKATGQRHTTNQPSQKDHLPLDNRPPKQLEAPPASAGKASLDMDMPKDLTKSTSNATSTIQVAASCMKDMIAAPQTEAIRSKTMPKKPASNQPPQKDHLPLDSRPSKQLEAPERSFMRKVLLGAVGIPLGVATRVAASAATISAVAAAPPACKTHTSFGMLGAIASKALDLSILPVSLVSAIAA